MLRSALRLIRGNSTNCFALTLIGTGEDVRPATVINKDFCRKPLRVPVFVTRGGKLALLLYRCQVCTAYNWVWNVFLYGCRVDNGADYNR